MRNVFRRLPLPAKLMLVGLVPLLFMLYLSFRLFAEKTENVATLKSYIDRIHQSANLTRLIDALQTERQYSFDYALKKNFGPQMIAQRPRTDSIIGALEARHDESLDSFAVYTFLENLRPNRRKIDSGALAANGVMHFYSSAIFRLNTLNGGLSENNRYVKGIYADMASQRLLSEMITYLGIINANVYNVLYTRQYMVETMLGTLPSYEVYNSYEKEFLQKASPAVVQQYNQLRAGANLRPVSHYLRTIFSTFKFDSTYDYKTWGTISVGAVDELRRLQTSLLNSVETRINAFYQNEKADKTRTLYFLMLALAAVAFIVGYTVHVINRMLSELKTAALKIANGATDLGLSRYPRDVIGSLADSVSKIDANNKTLAEAANAIGLGNFDVPVQPRSNADVLGNAVVQMKENLLRFTKDLRASRERFRQLADFMPQIVWTAGPDGHFDYYNKKWYEITGAPEGRDDQSWIPFLHPDDVGPCLTAWHRSVESGAPYEIECRFSDQGTGRYRWFLARALAITDDAGRTEKWFGTCTDIHDQKMWSRQMEETVAQRTEELQRSNDDLQQFAHVASHDLKEPLRKIKTFGGRLREECAAVLPERGKLYVDKIYGAADRLAKMVDGVLNYSIVNATDQAFECIDLNEVMTGIENDLEVAILQKEARVRYANLPFVHGVPPLIQQLFYNLLNNAPKFSNEGVAPLIAITSRKANAIDLQKLPDRKRHNEYAVIEIKDNGIGFDQAQAEKMFNVFTRLNSQEKYEGTGLGLALCKKIVLRHDGWIEAEGKKGEGALFRLLLPED